MPRCWAKNLALHLLKDENEHVEVHELRGFVSDDLVSALKEAEAISRGTRAKQFLYSLSLNPPPGENVSTKTFEDAVNRVENTLGLTGQSRAIVFHEKEGRRHAHAVWSRTDVEKMKAIPLPHTKRKLAEVSRELYIEHGWQMPRGFLRSEERDPNNFTLKQWQQAKRIGKDPREIKTSLRDCWAVSDSQGAFQQALKDRGYMLARGDRRGFVALDHRCEVFAVAKWVGLKTKEINARLTDKECLPSVDEAKEQIALDMAVRLTQLEQAQNVAIQTRAAEIEAKRREMARAHGAERRALKDVQAVRRQAETLARQKRFRTGLKGLLDRVTGRHRRIQEENERQALEAVARDRSQRDALIFQQLEARRTLQRRIVRLKNLSKDREQSLSRDIDQYREIRDKQKDMFDTRNRTRDNPPERER